MANNLYIFCIGGTGSRVLKSLTMLLASGVTMGTFDEIVPIIIDPDRSNGDKGRTEKILDYYKTIHDCCAVSKNCDFFKVNIKPLGQISIQPGASVGSTNNFALDIPNTQNTKFKDFINYQQLGANDPNKYLTELLFSDQNLNSDLDEGFKGNPNMGCIVLNTLPGSPTFQSIAQSINPGDRIFIVSSIFGGTGAAGFPLLLKNIRQGVVNGQTYAAMQNAPIGALSVLPYFKVKGNINGAQINSNTFFTKTKAALSYYGNNLGGINDLYYAGDTGNNNAYDYAEGKNEQQNNAHFIELISALAIIDFAQNAHPGTVANPVYKEFGIVNTQKALCFSDLSQNTNNIIQYPLKRYFYFNLFTIDSLTGRNLKHPYANCYKPRLNDDFFQNQKDSVFKTIQDFNLSFRIWLGEMAENDISFMPFLVSASKNPSDQRVSDVTPEKDNIFRLINGVNKKEKWFRADNIELFIKKLDIAAQKVGSYTEKNNETGNAAKRLLEIFSLATKELA